MPATQAGDKIIDMAGEPGETRQADWVERLPLALPQPLALAITLAAVAAACLLRALLHPLLQTGMAFITFFPVVIILTFLFGARMGIVATALSTVLAWLFFVSDPLQPSFVLSGVPALVPFLLLVSINIAMLHAMQQANAKLRRERARSAALAATRETLFRELQHRVSNNLQIAAGLLSLQKKHVADESARAAVEEAARRLAVIGRVSRQLYASDGHARSMAEFLAPLCADVVEMSGRAGVAVAIHAAEDVRLPPDAALPLALIVAETVANAIEHGFAAREHGSIEVSVARDPAGALVIEVADDGHGLPSDFDAAASGSLGLGIVRAFADQLGARFSLSGGERTVAQLVLPG